MGNPLWEGWGRYKEPVYIIHFASFRYSATSQL